MRDSDKHGTYREKGDVKRDWEEIKIPCCLWKVLLGDTNSKADVPSGRAGSISLSYWSFGEERRLKLCQHLTLPSPRKKRKFPDTQEWISGTMDTPSPHGPRNLKSHLSLLLKELYVNGYAPWWVWIPVLPPAVLSWFNGSKSLYIIKTFSRP